MKTIRRIVLAACLAFGPQAAFAQWTFSVTLHVSGECATREERTAIDNANNIWQTQVIPAMQQAAMTRAECERMRSYIESILNAVSYRDRYCSIYWTVGPCVGKDPPSAEILLGPSQGQSFLPSTPNEEIKNWSSNVIDRELQLGGKEYYQEYPKDHTSIHITTNKIEKARDDIRNVAWNTNTTLENSIPNDEHNPLWWPSYADYERYMETRNTLIELHDYFYSQTGYDIANILLKKPKTKADLEIIAQYMDWKLELDRQKDMALCSSLNYDDVDGELVEYAKSIGIEKKSLESFSETDPMFRLAKLIEMCNGESLNGGFHADLFFNSVTGEYTVSFRGTEGFETVISEFFKTIFKNYFTTIKNDVKYGELERLPEDIKHPEDVVVQALKALFIDGNTEILSDKLHDISTDFGQGFGEVLTQYKMAIEIGDVIRQIMEANPNVRINITGHSLGGGLGITAGTVSGAPTYVFNPAGVHENVFEYAGMSDKVASGNYNITRFSTDDDPLTNAQESSSPSWFASRTLAKGVVLGIVYKQTNDIGKAADFTSKTLPKPTGNKILLHTGKGHSIDPITHLMIKETGGRRSIARWDETKPECRIYFE